MDKVSIILPSTGRPERLYTALRSIEVTTRAADIELIVVIDADPHSKAIAEAFGAIVNYCKWYRGNMDCWNIGLEIATGRYIVFAADDLVFSDGWLEESMLKMATLPSGIGLVGFNDGHHNGHDLATHYIIHRQFIIEHMGGRLTWPCYQYEMVDRETTERAKRAGRYAWAEDARVRHVHWHDGERERDATDERNIGGQMAARAIYILREAAGFPDSWPAVIS